MGQCGGVLRLGGCDASRVQQRWGGRTERERDSRERERVERERGTTEREGVQKRIGGGEMARE